MALNSFAMQTEKVRQPQISANTPQEYVCPRSPEGWHTPIAYRTFGQRHEAFSAGKTDFSVANFSVAKVVKTFGCIAYTTETLDEFRYKMLHNIALRRSSLDWSSSPSYRDSV